MKPVTSKADFVRRYQLGEFGNAAPTWNTSEKFAQARWGLGQLFHLRNRVAGGETFYNISGFEALVRWCDSKDPLSWYVSAMAPTLLTIVQGEVQRGLWGLDLYYSTCCVPMREALMLDGRHCSGVQALAVLQSTMNQQSYEWLQYLLEAYEDHVVEFSVYDCEWGTVPGHNTVFWEVRCGY